MMIYYYLNVGEIALHNLRTISLRSTNGMVVPPLYHIVCCSSGQSVEGAVEPDAGFKTPWASAVDHWIVKKENKKMAVSFLAIIALLNVHGASLEFRRVGYCCCYCSRHHLSVQNAAVCFERKKKSCAYRWATHYILLPSHPLSVTSAKRLGQESHRRPKSVTIIFIMNCRRLITQTSTKTVLILLLDWKTWRQRWSSQQRLHRAFERRWCLTELILAVSLAVALHLVMMTEI